jgi:TolA-binding protein
MKGLLRIPLYGVLIIVCTVSLQRFLRVYNARSAREAARFDLEQWEKKWTDHGTPPAAESATNAPAAASTNAVADAGATNSPSSTPGATNAPAAAPAATTATDHLGLYGGVGVFSILALAILGAYDISRYLGQRAHQFIASEDGDGNQDAEYEEAERLWANGDHLGAVHVLREYLKRHPRRVHAHFRIAEIYEKDLHNPLAAALEHEEILKFKLEPERWGWAAIHLCNLYYHLNQEQKAEALLNRIVSEFGHTQAARKARKRLGLPEDGEAEEEAPEEPAVTEGGVQLPRGFRPKK